MSMIKLILQFYLVDIILSIENLTPEKSTPEKSSIVTNPSYI